ncbi:hypothetical protein D3C85_941830 [compost metagenome]
MGASNQRTHIQTAICTCTDFQGFDLRYQCADQRIRHLVTNTHGHRNRHAAFASRTKSRAHQGTGRVIQVRIRHQHRVVLRSAQGLYTLAALGAFGIDVFGNRRRPHKTQRFDFRSFNQCVHRFLIAVHHVQHAFWQTGIQQQLSNQQRRAWITLGRFEDKAVAADDRQRIHPQRHHGREVKRGDTSHYTQWLEI